MLATYRGVRVRVRVRAEVLCALLAERATRRLTLGPLPHPAVDELVGRTLRRRPKPALLRAVARRAEGNPLFVVELARLAAATGAPEPALPHEVSRVLARRLGRLAAPIREVLRAAAVLGREAPVALLGTLCGTGPAQVRDLLAPAVSDGLVLEDDWPGPRILTR